MTDYSKMSDFEINKQVAIVVGHHCYYENGSYTNDGIKVKVKGNGRIGLFNPCRRPEDAWPIIAEHQISIIFDADTMIDPPAHWVMCRQVSSNGDVAEYYEQPDRPLRAAMIVFLMMKEPENDS